MAKRNETSALAPTCPECKCAVGAEVGVLPMRVLAVDVADPNDPGAIESWCPQCFKYVRAAKEPERWSWIAIAARQCPPKDAGGCGVISIDMGHGACSGCGRRGGAVLPAKGQLLT